MPIPVQLTRQHSIMTYQWKAGDIPVFDAPFTLGVLDPRHIQVLEVGSVNGAGDQVYLPHTYDAINRTVTVTSGLPNRSAVITVQRTVPKDALYVSFTRGADVSRQNLDDNSRYMLMILHESIDGRLSLIPELEEYIQEAVVAAGLARLQADRAAQEAARARNAADAATAAAQQASLYSFPRFATRELAAAGAASWPNGTVLYVEERKFVVDTTGPDRLLALTYDYRGKLENVISRMTAKQRGIIACYGDSTTDGNGTGQWTANPTNTNGTAIGAGDHNPPNAWPAILHTTLREMFGHNNISVWNAGYGGKEIVTGWARNNFARAVINNPAYGKPDVVLLNFGLNDMVRAVFTRDLFETELRYLINLLDYHGVTPVFMTPDPVSEPTARQGGSVEVVNTVYRDFADRYGITVIDSGQALHDVYSSNGTNNLWVYQQPDNLHGGNSWHSVKGSYVAARLFPKTLFLTERINNIPAWSKYANTQDTTYTIYDRASNRFGGCAIVSQGTYTLGQTLATVWVWNVRPNMQSMWFSVDGDGYYHPRAPANAPRLRVYSYHSRSTYVRNVMTAGMKAGVIPYRQSETPMTVGNITAGLSKVEYVAPMDIVTQPVFLGYFSFRERVRTVSTAARFPDSGAGRTISDSDEYGSYGVATGFGFGRPLTLTMDVNMPRGGGVHLFQGRVYGAEDPLVTRNRVGLLFFRGNGNIALYLTDTSTAGVNLIGSPLATTAYTWKDGNNEFTFDFVTNNSGQVINVYAPDVEAPVLTVVRPLTVNPIISGGDVGGLFYNYSVATGGTVKATIYDITT